MIVWDPKRQFHLIGNVNIKYILDMKTKILFSFFILHIFNLLPEAYIFQTYEYQIHLPSFKLKLSHSLFPSQTYNSRLLSSILKLITLELSDHLLHFQILFDVLPCGESKHFPVHQGVRFHPRQRRGSTRRRFQRRRRSRR